MVQNSIVKKQESFGQYMAKEVTKNAITKTFGEMKGQQFISAVVSAVTNNPELQKCGFDTIVAAAMQGESLQLSPSPQLGQYYMVPFNDTRNDRKVATFQLGYKGYIQLAIRSGYYKKINVLAIKEGELVKYDPLSEEIEVNLIEDDTQREAAKTIGYYAMFEYLNGFRKTLYWSKAKMHNHATTYSFAFANDQKKGYSYSFWTKEFDAMALKTMIRQLISKWGIMSVELQKALEYDNFDTESSVPQEKKAPQNITPADSFFDVSPADVVEDENGVPIGTKNQEVK